MASLTDMDALDAAPVQAAASAVAPIAAAPRDYQADADAEDYRDYQNWRAQHQPGAPDPGGDVVVAGPDTVKRWTEHPPTAPATARPVDGVGGAATQSGNGGLGPSGAVGPTHRAVDQASPLSRMDAAEAATAAPASPAAKASGKKTGLLANIAAGGNEAAAGALGMPVDLATGALNLVPRGINAATGANLPTIQSPVGGSEWWKGAMGMLGADPRTVEPDGFGQQALRGAAAGAVGALLPLGIAGQVARAGAALGPVVRGVAATLAAPSAVGTGVAGGVGGLVGQAAEYPVAESYKPIANMAGQMLGGGVAALGEAAAAGAGRAVQSAGKAALAPISSTSRFAPEGMRPIQMMDGAGNVVTATPWQAELAVRKLAGASGTSAGDLAASIPSQADYTLVPGSTPTLGQATGNSGVLSVERGIRTRNPQPFADAEAGNSVARNAAVRGVAPGSHADVAGQYVQRRLGEIEAATDAEITTARKNADAWLAQHGAHGQAADYGQAIREGVEQRLAPAVQAAEQAHAASTARIELASAAMGGQVSPGALQRHGAAIRDAVLTALRGNRAAVSRLFEAIDPEGKLALSSGGMRAAGRSVRAELEPGSGMTFTPRVEHWVATLENMPPVVSYKSLKQTRQGIGEALRAQGIEPSEKRQLTMLRNGVDDALADAVARQAGAEAPHVEAGHLGPDEALLGKLAQERNDHYNRRDVPVPKAVREDDVRLRGDSGVDGVGEAGRSGAAAPALGEVRGSKAGSSGGAGASDVQGNASQPATGFSAADAEAYRAARTAKVDQVKRFEGAPSDITAAGQNGAEFRVADSQVAARFWNSGTKAAESAQSLVLALGSREAALAEIGDYAAMDLRTAPGVTRADGTFNAQKIQAWIAAHREALDTFPELRERFGTLARAQTELDGVVAQRAALDAAHPIAAGTTNADVAGKYWRPGRNGAEAAQEFGKDVGTAAEHTALLSDTATASLQTAAMKNGVFNEAAYNRWMAAHEPALSAAPPKLRQRLEDFGTAQRTVEDAMAAKAEQMKAYQDSAARFYLGRDGEVRDPLVAMGRLMSSDNPGTDAAQLMRIVGGDLAAKDGVRRNLADWIMSKARSTSNAGTTQEKQIAKAALDKIMNDPKSARALAAVFEPEQVAALRAVVADMDREAMSVNATRIPGSPGTAADLHSIGHGEHADGATTAIGAEIMGEAASHAVGLTRLPGLALKAGSVGMSLVFRGMRAGGMKQVTDLQTAAVLNPEIARIILSRPAPAARIGVLTKLAGLLGDLSISGGERR